MRPHKKKSCKKHGTVTFYEEISKDGTRWRCSKCRNEATTRRRQEQKKKLIDLFGGSCSKCGYNKCVSALQFHHKDPKIKDFGISKAKGTHSLKELVEEAKKCVLVCANCHAEIHAGVAQR